MLFNCVMSFEFRLDLFVENVSLFLLGMFSCACKKNDCIFTKWATFYPLLLPS